MPTIKTVITKKAIEEFPPPTTGRAHLADTKVPGLLLEITPTGSRAWKVYRKHNGKPVRVTLGKYPDMTIDQARRKAAEVLAQLAGGTNPNTEKREARAKTLTLAECYANYVALRSLKPNTASKYQAIMKSALADWLKLPLAGITRDMVARRHHKLGEENGGAWANLTMRILRAIYNDAMGRELVADNPVLVLKQTRTWHRVQRRQTIIKPHELGPWWRAVQALENAGAADYLVLLLLTGLRMGEGLRLRWEDVDLRARTLTARDTKNHSDHTLPLPDYLHDMLARRRRETMGEWVFPGETKAGHMDLPRKPMTRVTAATGIEFSAHDLRRTFATVAESLDIPAYAIKRLLNHASGSDVTAGYVVVSVERLRGPMQRIADYILRMAGVRETAEVVELRLAE